VGTRTLNIETTTHGRVLIEDAAVPVSRGWIVGFHGYGQAAEDMLDELRRLTEDGAWSLAAPQGLHRFYARGDERVVASWMTRQDRDLAVADNLRYVIALLGSGLALRHPETAVDTPLVFVGFSQGAAMAYRAAVLAADRSSTVIALAGDIPPEVRDADPARVRARLRRVLIGVGTRETWFTPDKRQRDTDWLRALDIDHDVVTFDGGHEWTEAFRAAARDLLRLSAGAGE
jgi:predicted esterase